MSKQGIERRGDLWTFPMADKERESLLELVAPEEIANVVKIVESKEDSR